MAEFMNSPAVHRVQDVVCQPRYILKGVTALSMGILLFLGYFHYKFYYHTINTCNAFTTTPNAVNNTELYHNFNNTIYDIAGSPPSGPLWTFALMLFTFVLGLFGFCYA